MLPVCPIFMCLFECLAGCVSVWAVCEFGFFSVCIFFSLGCVSGWMYCVYLFGCSVCICLDLGHISVLVQCSFLFGCSECICFGVV